MTKPVYRAVKKSAEYADKRLTILKAVAIKKAKERAALYNANDFNTNWSKTEKICAKQAG